MIRVALAVALLAVCPAVAPSGCCYAVSADKQGRYIRIVNTTSQWVECWLGGNYQFQIPPQSKSRAYPSAPWGCQ